MLVVVGNVQFVGQFAGPRDLVALAFVLGEANGERMDVWVFLGQQCGHVARVDARGKERTHFYVGDVVIAHAFAHGLVDCFHRVGLAATFVEVVRGVPPALDFDFAIRANGQAVALRQLEDALEERFVQGAELEAQVLCQRPFVQLALVSGVLQDALDFRCENELALLLRVVEGLNAEVVARAEELVGGAVPNGECEHAAQAREGVFAPGQVAGEQHFGVGVGAERPAVCLKLGAQIAVVVDFAVEYDGEIARGQHVLFGAARRTVQLARG